MKTFPYSQAYLHEMFTIAGEQLIFKVRPRAHFKTEGAWKSWNTKFAGKATGCLSPNGYTYVSIGHKLFGAHVIVAAMHGIQGVNIDHINGDKSDNHISNLRAATCSQNAVNGKDRTRKHNLPRGVYLKKNGLYVARLHKDNKTHNLGTFDSVCAAEAARLNAVRKAHGEFARA